MNWNQVPALKRLKGKWKRNMQLLWVMTEVDRAKERSKDRVSPAKGQENRQGGNAQEAQD